MCTWNDVIHQIKSIIQQIYYCQKVFIATSNKSRKETHGGFANVIMREQFRASYVL